MSPRIVITKLGDDYPDQVFELNKNCSINDLREWFEKKAQELLDAGAVDVGDMDQPSGATYLEFDQNEEPMYLGEVGIAPDSSFVIDHEMWPELQKYFKTDDPAIIDGYDLIKYILSRHV